MRAWYKNVLAGRLWLNGTFRILPGTGAAYLTAAIFVALASLIRWGLGFAGTPLLPFTAYYPAVLFTTYIGGLGVGSFAAFNGSVETSFEDSGLAFKLKAVLPKNMHPVVAEMKTMEGEPAS